MVSAIIQARLNSNRLPGKVLLALGEKTVLENVIERARKAKHIKQVSVATSNEISDDEIVELCRKKKTPCFRGSLYNVLDRYYRAAKKFKIKIICRVTADCPLVDPKIIDVVTQKYLDGNFDYVSNAYPVATYPDGLDVEVFSFRALEKAWRETKLLSEKEHVTPYIWKNPEKFKLYNLKNNIDLSYMRWTVDEEKDLKFIREVYKTLYKKGSIFYMEDVLNLIGKRPKLMSINKDIIRNKGYLKSLEDDKLMKT